jgi:hypothetical protein
MYDQVTAYSRRWARRLVVVRDEEVASWLTVNNGRQAHGRSSSRANSADTACPRRRGGNFGGNTCPHADVGPAGGGQIERRHKSTAEPTRSGSRSLECLFAGGSPRRGGPLGPHAGGTPTSAGAHRAGTGRPAVPVAERPGRALSPVQPCAGVLTASASPRTSVQIADEYRRRQAVRAIARIQDCYRRGLAIPDVTR